MTEYVEIQMTPLSLTERAVLADVGAGADIWLPLSQFETPPDDSDVHRSGVYEIKEWIAKEKGLI